MCFLRTIDDYLRLFLVVMTLGINKEAAMNMLKKCVQGLILVTASGIGCQAMAQSESVSVKLEHLEAIHTQEKNGDELYFSITEYPQGEMPSHYQVPRYPTHWLSKYLNNVQNVMLWNKGMESCKNVDVVISLVEEDFFPWNLDDRLGSVKFTVTCEQGKVKTGWVIAPDEKTTEKILNEKDAFSFKGKDADYRAVFKVEEAPLTQIQKEQLKKEELNPHKRKVEERLPIPFTF